MLDAISFLDLSEVAWIETIKFKSEYSRGFFFCFVLFVLLFVFYISSYVSTCSNCTVLTIRVDVMIQ